MDDEQKIKIEEKSLLISDSNEVLTTQLDSKKIPYSTLKDILEDAFFKKNIRMSDYLTEDRFEIDKSRLPSVSEISSEAEPKLRAVEGQIILINGDYPKGDDLVKYIKTYWEIPIGYKLEPINESMLRGMLYIEDENRGKVRGEKQVQLKSENMPKHRHHEAITEDANILTMEEDSTSSIYSKNGSFTYDIFDNNSNQIGISNDDLDYFDIQNSGEKDGVYHNNLPKCAKTYGFQVVKN